LFFLLQVSLTFIPENLTRNARTIERPRLRHAQRQTSQTKISRYSKNSHRRKRRKKPPKTSKRIRNAVTHAGRKLGFWVSSAGVVSSTVTAIDCLRSMSASSTINSRPRKSWNLNLLSVSTPKSIKFESANPDSRKPAQTTV
jgi:hypothetical protein